MDRSPCAVRFTLELWLAAEGCRSVVGCALRVTGRLACAWGCACPPGVSSPRLPGFSRHLGSLISGLIIASAVLVDKDRGPAPTGSLCYVCWHHNAWAAPRIWDTRGCIGGDFGILGNSSGIFAYIVGILNISGLASRGMHAAWSGRPVSRWQQGPSAAPEGSRAAAEELRLGAPCRLGLTAC